MSKQREIRYREYLPDGRSDKFHYWGLIDGQFIAPCNPKNPQNEFTGLKDKNGKEIYEGDLLQSRAIQTDIECDIWTVDVRYEEAYFCYGWHGDPLDEKECATKMEVIGNIYETANWKELVGEDHESE